MILPRRLNDVAACVHADMRGGRATNNQSTCLIYNELCITAAMRRLFHTLGLLLVPKNHELGSADRTSGRGLFHTVPCLTVSDTIDLPRGFAWPCAAT
jgi:hypothetical protein